MQNLRIGQPSASLMPTTSGNTAVAVFRSSPYKRHPGATLVTLVVQGNQNGTLDIEALRVGGDPDVPGDWYVFNTPTQQVAVAAGVPAWFICEGAPEITRALYTPVASATITFAQGTYAGHNGGAA